MYYVYKIENIITKDSYIGSTNHPFGRWKSHFNRLGRKSHNTKFQCVFDRSDISDWSFRIIESNISTKEDAFDREEFHRDLLKATLNGTDRIHKIISRKNLDKSILSMVKSGKTYRWIAKELGCSVGKVCVVVDQSKNYFF